MSVAGHDRDVLLEMRGIEKRFFAVRALRGVDLRVRRGEVHGLIGENGAGKSTLMKVLSGALSPDAGSMSLSGVPYAPRGPSEARDQGVCMIYQELTLSGPLTVAENLFLGREPRRLGRLDRRVMRERAERVLALFPERELSPERRVEELSPAARQLVEIARALMFDARVVVMDEPTSSLSQRDVEPLFDTIDRLRARGVAVIYISHFLEEVRRVAQRFTVLRDGVSVASGEVEKTKERARAFDQEVLTLMAGRTLAEAYPRVPHERGEVRLEVQELSGHVRPTLAGLSLRRGEILGVFGLMGAGRTELLRVLFGLDRAVSGRVRLAAGGPFATARVTPPLRWHQKIGMVSEDRKEEGLALGLSVADNLTLSRPPKRAGIVLSRAEQYAITERLGARLGLRYRAPGQRAAELSGGNQQKVALLRLLHHDVDVYLLDEPTRGIDVGSKAAIYRLLGELAAQGKAVLMVSSYLPELTGICDRIAVMCRGRLGEARDAADWTPERLLAAATGDGAEETPR